MNTQEFDILMIGAGILGACVAAEASRNGYSVCGIRLPDSQQPQADTLRNQSWLQSGILPMDGFRKKQQADVGLKLGLKMMVWGQRLLHESGINTADSDERGMIRLGKMREVEELLEDAAALKMSKWVSEVDPEIARQRLASIHDEKAFYYSIPDSPFDEATILKRMRSFATNNGACLLQDDEPAQIIKDPNAPGGIAVRVGSEILRARTVLLLAGAGSYPILESLGLEPGFTFRQTPLLVLPSQGVTNVPIYADRKHGYSFVTQPDASGDPVLIVGTSVREKNVKFCPSCDREVTLEHQKEFEGHLPNALRDLLSEGRYTAGRELIPNREQKRSHLEPWVRTFKNYPTLIHATPGRATLALYTTKRIMDSVKSRIGKGRKQSPAFPKLTSWNDDISMHYDSFYGFNDASN